MMGFMMPVTVIPAIAMANIPDGLRPAMRLPALIPAMPSAVAAIRRLKPPQNAPHCAAGHDTDLGNGQYPLHFINVWV